MPPTTPTAPPPVPRRRLVLLNPAYCKSCAICVDLCPKHALALDPTARQVMFAKAEACNGCGLCEFLCPDYVLMLVPND